LHYRTEPFGFAYHYEKDLIAYVIIATIFWLFAFREAAPTAGQEEGTPRTTFDIEDGRRHPGRHKGDRGCPRCRQLRRVPADRRAAAADARLARRDK
jgi:hypothetical protein